MTIHIIRPEFVAGNVDLASKLRFVAGVGPLGAVTVLDLDSRAPLSAGEHLYQRQLSLYLKQDRMLALSEGQQSTLPFFRLQTRLQVEQLRLRVAEQRLAERCRAALRRHELAKMRLTTQLERERGRAAAAGAQQQEAEARRREAADRHRAEQTFLRDGQRYADELLAARHEVWESAERAAAAARAAASPLARLSWRANDTPPDALPFTDAATAEECLIPLIRPAQESLQFTSVSSVSGDPPASVAMPA